MGILETVGLTAIGVFMFVGFLWQLSRRLQPSLTEARVVDVTRAIPIALLKGVIFGVAAWSCIFFTGLILGVASLVVVSPMADVPELLRTVSEWPW